MCCRLSRNIFYNTADTAFEPDLLKKDQKIIYFIKNPKKDRGFHAAFIQGVNRDSTHWIKFYVDGYRSKVDDLTEANYMKTWAFASVAEESQEPWRRCRRKVVRWVHACAAIRWHGNAEKRLPAKTTYRSRTALY